MATSKKASTADGAAPHHGATGEAHKALKVPTDPDAVADFLASMPTNATPVGPQDKSEGQAAMDEYADELADLQEKFWAESHSGREHRILLVLQGMDTSGKGGIIKHAIGLVNPAGIRTTAFKAPTEEERRHSFLWRIRKALPDNGEIGIFDRSDYEDVLIVKVRKLADAATIEKRYGQINRFEQGLVDEGYTIIKCFLNLSYEQQRENLLARLDDPTKHWKFNEGDIDERQLWPDYQAAYFDALTRCNSDAAPWFVIPADRKWYRKWAVGQLLLETLRDIDPQYPDMNLDIERLRNRLGED